MSIPISDQLYSLLDKYCCSVGGVLGAGISTTSGLEISSNFNKIADSKTAHAVSSCLYNQSQHAVNKLGLKGFNTNITYTDEGIIALRKVNNNAVIMVLMKPDANVGLVLVEMENFMHNVRELL